MQKSDVLRLVTSQDYYENEVRLINSSRFLSHSLHNSICLKNKLNPEIASHFIEKYSTIGDVVLDPFCGLGTIPLEANFKKRISYSSDINKLFIKITKAKSNPIPFSKLVFVLQSIDTKRLVKLGNYEKYFAPFFDIDTYKEILSIKEYISKNKHDIADYIEFLLMSVLHGPNTSFCSSPTYQEFSITPCEQNEMNMHRRLFPEYRSVISRLLRRASLNEQDLFPSFFEELNQKNKFCLTDARNIHYVASSSVDLILTEPPLYTDKYKRIDYWLKNWIAGIDDEILESNFVQDLDSWTDFMNEVLMEFVRVLKPNKRIVLILRDSNKFGKSSIHKMLLNLVNKHLSRYLTPEKCLIEISDGFKGVTKEDIKTNQTQIDYKYLVLKKL